MQALTRQPTCSLYFPAGQSGLAADAAQPGGFNHDAVEHVHSKGLHHLHALLGDPHIWMHLFQDSAAATKPVMSGKLYTAREEKHPTSCLLGEDLLIKMHVIGQTGQGSS